MNDSQAPCVFRQGRPAVPAFVTALFTVATPEAGFRFVPLHHEVTDSHARDQPIWWNSANL